MESPDASVSHREYLHETSDDPRLTLISKLLDVCSDTGSIIAYYSKFQYDQIKALAEFSPQHRASLINLTKRLVDPLTIIREAIYDNRFEGSLSLKKIAHALLGSKFDYNTMEITDGKAAQRAFEALVSTNTTASKKKKLKKSMLEYCKKDALVMVAKANRIMNTNY